MSDRAVAAPMRVPVLPPVLSILLAILSVQLGAAIAKGLFPLLGAGATAGLRIGLSALMLLAVFRPSLGRLTAEQWRAVLPYGAVLGAMNLLFYLALERIPLGLCVTIEFLGPLAVAVAGSRRPSDAVWVVMAGAGIALIAPWHGGGVDPVGILLALCAATGWAAYIVLGGRLSRLLPGGVAVAVGLLVGGAAILPFTIAGGALARLTPSLLARAGALALLSSAIPFTLEMSALRALPARTFSILMSLEPAVAALCGAVFLHERLSIPQWSAVALVIAASAGATLTAPSAPVRVEA